MMEDVNVWNDAGRALLPEPTQGERLEFLEVLLDWCENE